MYESILNAAICYGLGLLLILIASLLCGLFDTVLTRVTRYELSEGFCNIVLWSVGAPAFITGTLLLVQAFLI